MLKVYVCTPLKTEKFKLELISRTLLEQNVFGFIPPQGQLVDKKLGSLLDKRHIDLCNEVWVFGPIGRDCAWEIGYATGLGKNVKIFVDESNMHVINEDWMTVIGVELVYCENIRSSK